MKITIRRKLLLSIIAVLTALYLVVCVVTCLFVRGQLIRQAHRDNRQVLLQAGQQLDVVLRMTDMTARQVMTDEDLYAVEELTRSGDPSRKFVTMARADSILRQYIALNPFVANIAVISSDDMVFSNRGPLLADDFRARTDTDWFRAFMESPERSLVSDVHMAITRNVEQPAVTMCYKYRNIQELAGRENYLMIDIDLSQFAAILDSETAGHRMLVTNGKGQAIVPSLLVEAESLAVADTAGGILELPGFVILHESMESAGWNLYYPIPRSEFNRPITQLLLSLIAAFLLVLAVSIYVLSRVIGRIISPVHSITTTMQAAYNGNLDVEADVRSGDELEILSDCFNKLISDLRAHIGKLMEQEQVKKQMQLDLLMSQIHPHFIYNTLNSAVYLIEEEEGEQAIEVIYSLINILQDTVRIGSKEIFTTVEGEILLTRSYLAIAAVRYPGMFRADINCDPALLDEPIPKVLIQPLVENAIHHGILPVGRDGAITVDILRSHDGRLVIRVEDDGVGVDGRKLDDALRGRPPQDATAGTHGVGLSNIRNRISFLYNEAGHSFAVIPREGGGTRVEICLPIDGPVTAG